MSMPPVGPVPAKIMIVGEFPGEMEVNRNMPFVGSAGDELSNQLKEVGIMRSSCLVTNVVRIRPPANDISHFIAMKKASITGQHKLLRDKFVLPCVVDGIEMLKREIEMCQPNVILALGNTALWALTGKWGVSSWRGSVLQTDLPLNLPYLPKVVPTHHPSMILRRWSWRNIALQDLRRMKKESERREVIRPDYKFITRPSFDDVMLILGQLYEQLEAARRAGEEKHPRITNP